MMLIAACQEQAAITPAHWHSLTQQVDAKRAAAAAAATRPTATAAAAAHQSCVHKQANLLQHFLLAVGGLLQLAVGALLGLQGAWHMLQQVVRGVVAAGCPGPVENSELAIRQKPHVHIFDTRRR